MAKEHGMLVKDLIELLKTFPAEMEVWIDHSESLSIAPLKSATVDDNVLVISHG